jgi:hypothetical protein
MEDLNFQRYLGGRKVKYTLPENQNIISTKTHTAKFHTHTHTHARARALFQNSVSQIRTNDINPFHIQNSYFWEISIQKANADNTGSFFYTIYNLLSPLFYNLQPCGTVRMAASKAF